MSYIGSRRKAGRLLSPLRLKTHVNAEDFPLNNAHPHGHPGQPVG